jgi:large subunit ribosomal protein L23
MIKPIQSEKSMQNSELGRYSFWVPVNMTKSEIKERINKIFNVKVKSIRTIKSKKTTRRNLRGQFVTTMPRKKAIVILSGDQKIDAFGEEKKKKTKKSKK